MSAEENTYVRDQNARVDPLFTIGAVTVAGLREIITDLPDDAVVVVARPDRDGADCSPLADAQPCWYLPRSGEHLPIGRDGEGNVHEPGPDDLYAVLLQPAA
ncbi:hypothetical protein AB0M54_44735 [Actinoplanes sp. NPDC051470]|uniref:hypothetical protein n=1 Tax=unclassified Actinoplanes TaxID=2626549 RepID=UPI003430C355